MNWAFFIIISKVAGLSLLPVRSWSVVCTGTGTVSMKMTIIDNEYDNDDDDDMDHLGGLISNIFLK